MRQAIQGWGRYPTVEAEIAIPASPRAAREILASSPRGASWIARGLGRSYGDSSLNGQALDANRLNLLLDFDDATGILRCGAGVSLADIIEVFLPRGWFPAVTPGTRFVSVGGAIASDVHGKNHHLHGCFSEYVNSIDLLLASGDIVNCSRRIRPELFRATCGGMGLTGIIVAAEIRLRRVGSAFIDQVIYKTTNLADTLALFEAKAGITYSVAWLDCLATGSALGRSLVMVGEHAEEGPLQVPAGRPVSVPVEMPSWLLNRPTVKAFNFLYYQRLRTRQCRQRVGYDAFFYPLDGIGSWNRLYGKGGFTQYQFVIPRAAGLGGLRPILECVAASGRGSFLAVLKAFGEENANFLSFPMAGYTLALDFKLGSGLFRLLDELDAMVLDQGGRLYLAKDVRMGEATFKRGYPRWDAFQEVRAACGAIGRFASRQSRRIGLD